VAPPDFDAAWRQRQAYQPFFCEENVWHLLRSAELQGPRAALFVTNATRSVAMWGQRAARRDPVVWDYHVVALLCEPALVLDLDDRERVDRPLAAWLAHAFRPGTEPQFAPRFRLVDGDEFLAVFSSDRSHMRDARGRARQPFPPWPAPFDAARGHNLPRFVDLDDAIAGRVLELEELSRSAHR
jgi:hypothetical protein